MFSSYGLQWKPGLHTGRRGPFVFVACFEAGLVLGGVKYLGEASSPPSPAPPRSGSEAKRKQQARCGKSDPTTSLRVRKEIKGKNFQLKKHKGGKYVLSFQQNHSVHFVT